jgi:hypothetical protein
MMTEKRSAVLLGTGLSVFFALVQFRLIVLVLGPNYGRAVDAAAGVLNGHPHWRAFQPRVLGPLLVELTSLVLPSFLAAHVFYSIATLAVMGFLAWRLGWRYGGTIASALLALFAFEASFAFLLSPPWLYAWDYLDIIVFLVFVEFVIEGKSWPWFACLLVIGILNRQSAAFIAVWMILEALSRWHFGRKDRHAVPLDWTFLAAGISGLVLAMAIDEAITRMFFIEEIGPKIFTDVGPEKAGQFQKFQLFTNLRLAWGALTQFQYTLPFLILVFLGVCLALAVALMRTGRRYVALGLTFITMVLADLGYGYFTETRVYVELIPLVVLGVLVLTRGAAAPPVPSAATRGPRNSL